MSDHKAGGCPDGGVCHHWCADGPCFRVGSCGPLSGVFPGDQWPTALRAAGGQEHEDWCRYHDATGCASQPRPAAPVGGQAEPSDAEVRAYWDEHAKHTNPDSAAAEWEAVRAGLRAAARMRDHREPCQAKLPGALVGNTVPCLLDRGHGGEHSAWYGVAR